MTDTTTIQETKVLWDKTADKLYVWDAASGAWELFFVAADLVTNDALTDDLALKVSIAGDTMTGALELPNIGVNTTPNSTNRLAVKSNAVLLAALETGAGGSGDMRAVVSKQAASNTASFLYQDDYSGRAEIGLCGDDNFHFKVSPDGSTFFDGIVLDKTNGRATFLTAPIVSGMTAGSIPFIGASGLVGQDNTNLFWDDTNDFLGVATNAPSAKIDVVAIQPVRPFQVTSYGSSAGVFAFRAAAGTPASPAVIGSGQAAGAFVSQGYDGVSAYQTVANVQAVVIEPTPGPTAMGGQWRILVPKLGTVGVSEIATYDWQSGFRLAGSQVIDANGIIRPRSYTCATLPAATTTGLIHVSDDGGGPTLAYCDGSHWRRVMDDQIVSTANSHQVTFANALAFSPPSSVTPATNGQVMFEATSNTSFKIKFKGSDGTVRSATLTLS